MKILITGATGFVGREIGKKLIQNGHQLVVTSRNKLKAKDVLPFPAEIIQWDGLSEMTDYKTLKGVEAVCHLAGEPVAEKRWNEQVKKDIYDSRVLGTKYLKNSLEKAGASVQSFVSASAIGYYGDRNSEVLTEESLIGQGFLTKVCDDWEKAVFENQILSCKPRYAVLRIGIVLGRSGGALSKLTPIFKKGVGGAIGSGKAWMSWIHLQDLANAFVFVLENKKASGVFNATAPTPVTNKVFTKALGKVLKVPTIATVPPLALDLLYGEMAQVVKASQRVSSQKLIENGFGFQFQKIDEALMDIYYAENQGDQLLEREQWLDASISEVFGFFSDEKNLEELTPPLLRFKVEGKSTLQISEGTLINYNLKIRGVPTRWVTLIKDWVPGKSFIDIQKSGPYKKWEHLHTFVPMGRGTLMTDKVQYQLPLGALGHIGVHWLVKKDLVKIFDYRWKAIRKRFPFKD